MSDEDVLNLRSVHYFWDYRGSHDEWPADLHFTEVKVFASPTNETPEKKLKELDRININYQRLTNVKLYFNRRHPFLALRWKTGSHWWNISIASFNLSNETFQLARTSLPQLMQEKGIAMSTDFAGMEQVQ